MAGHERDDGGFLARWAERKSEAKQGGGDVADAAMEEGGADSGVLTGAAAVEPPKNDPAALDPAEFDPAEFDPADLPDIDTLNKDSDFSVFMNTKVPEALRRRALRRLWKVDPTFAFRDGMNDYDEDYTDAAMVVEGMKTLYQVGKGMVNPEDPDEDVDLEQEGDAAEVGQAGEDEPEEAPAGGENPEAEPQPAPSDEPETEARTAEPLRRVEGSAPAQAALPAEPVPQGAVVEAESTIDPGSPDSGSRPAGRALRRRWGDQPG